MTGLRLQVFFNGVRLAVTAAPTLALGVYAGSVAAVRLGRRTALSFPLLPPPQKN